MPLQWTNQNRIQCKCCGPSTIYGNEEIEDNFSSSWSSFPIDVFKFTSPNLTSSNRRLPNKSCLKIQWKLFYSRYFQGKFPILRWRIIKNSMWNGKNRREASYCHPNAKESFKHNNSYHCMILLHMLVYTMRLLRLGASWIDENLEYFYLSMTRKEMINQLSYVDRRLFVHELLYRQWSDV